MRGKDFFKQKDEMLLYFRKRMEDYLLEKNYTLEQIQLYVNAYNYFWSNPNNFDGATLVKDLHDISKLDLDAMLHDYHWLIYNVASNFKYQFLSNYAYSFGMRKKGKKIAPITRMIGLTIIMPFAFIYSICKRGFINEWQKKQFKKDYKTLKLINGAI